MKKLSVIAVAAALMFSLTACGEGDIAASSQTASTEAVSSAVVSTASVDAGKYENTLSGLCNYMIDSGTVIQEEGQPEEMQASFIGAKSGLRYVFSKNPAKDEKNLSVEFYEYDLDNLSDEAKTCLKSARENGTVPVFNDNVKAVLSKNGKYLMIYHDSVSNDDHQQMEQAATQEFENFKA